MRAQPPLIYGRQGVPMSSRVFSARQTLAAVGIAAIVAAGGGAAIYAATDGASQNWGGPGPPGMHGPGPGGMHGPDHGDGFARSAVDLRDHVLGE